MNNLKSIPQTYHDFINIKACLALLRYLPYIFGEIKKRKCTLL